MGVTEGKNEIRKNEDKHLNFHLHNTLCLPKVYSCTQNLKTLALIRAEESATEIFIGEKEK